MEQNALGIGDNMRAIKNLQDFQLHDFVSYNFKNYQMYYIIIYDTNFVCQVSKN